MNKSILIGRLVRDPELKYTPGAGTAVVTLTLAIDRRTGKESDKKEADFIPVVIWGKTAEATAQYTRKGQLLAVSGRIQTRKYEKDGRTIYVTEVVAEEVQFLEFGKKSNDGYNNDGYSDMEPVDDGEIPF